ncbi:TadE-like protein [Klenkia soli]|uniref:TadE-like protein n=1 Tax=Klenkia soli TaxID=1052260 RepID=A0A1H0T0L2_9ACTN|nr:TadE/TadG family type IV pilus assembly protein [Klenkia soli]SDP47583.1 TadE-like protein [Klenkia soli]
MTRTRRTGRFGRPRGERGASAVEFALVVPLLLLFLFSIVSVSRAFQVQAALSGAAREAARDYAINDDVASARTRAVNAAGTSAVTLSTANISISPSSCATAGPGADVTVTITYTFQPTGSYAAGLAFPITGKALYRCGR